MKRFIAFMCLSVFLISTVAAHPRDATTNNDVGKITLQKSNVVCDYTINITTSVAFPEFVAANHQFVNYTESNSENILASDYVGCERYYSCYDVQANTINYNLSHVNTLKYPALNSGNLCKAKFKIKSPSTFTRRLIRL